MRVGSGVMLSFVLLVVFLLPVPKRYHALRQTHLGAGVLDPWRQALRDGFMAERLGATIAELSSTAVVVADYHEIQLPFSAGPGPYRWGVVLYRTLPEGGWENLKVAGTDRDVAFGSTFEVREGR